MKSQVAQNWGFLNDDAIIGHCIRSRATFLSAQKGDYL